MSSLIIYFTESGNLYILNSMLKYQYLTKIALNFKEALCFWAEDYNLYENVYIYTAYTDV